jgi:hypothetical protein
VKKGRRRKLHHHHRINALLIQYDHLNAEERLLAFEEDTLALAEKLDREQAGKVMDKLREKMRVHR